MANAILLVSLMAVLLCLASIGCAQDDSELKIEARRLIDIYNNPEVDTATKFNNLESLAKFYEQHSDHYPLPKDQKQRASELLERHKQAALQSLGGAVLVVGAPGGHSWELYPGRVVVIDGATRTVGEAVNHLKSSAKGVEMNKQVAIFGLVFLVTSYMFRTQSM
ncbi:protein Turandot M-like [Drosophila obscura]|uniref:protein Turandot M-like n=1 Tax=Drosophila obscura TaxID=7282 RepID=UPI000BA13364|nr:protein Turandot M-like [Drosophila obscura]